MRITSGRNFVEADGSPQFIRYAVRQFENLLVASADERAVELENRARQYRLRAEIEAHRVDRLLRKRLLRGGVSPTRGENT